jgi:hypothetical protein
LGHVALRRQSFVWGQPAAGDRLAQGAVKLLIEWTRRLLAQFADHLRQRRHDPSRPLSAVRAEPSPAALMLFCHVPPAFAYQKVGLVLDLCQFGLAWFEKMVKFS